MQEKREYFSKQINDLFSKNYNTSICLDIEGRQRIYIQFKINKKGNIIDIKARAPHPKLEEEAKRIINLLPELVPAKEGREKVIVVYTLPVILEI